MLYIVMDIEMVLELVKEKVHSYLSSFLPKYDMGSSPTRRVLSTPCYSYMLASVPL